MAASVRRSLGIRGGEMIAWKGRRGVGRQGGHCAAVSDGGRKEEATGPHSGAWRQRGLEGHSERPGFESMLLLPL